MAATSKCSYLPAEDRVFLANARLTGNFDEDDDISDSDCFSLPEAEDLKSSPHPSASIVSRLESANLPIDTTRLSSP